MGSQPSVRSWLVNLGLAGDAVEVVIALFSGQDAVRWADAEHRRGQEDRPPWPRPWRTVRAGGSDPGGGPAAELAPTSAFTAIFCRAAAVAVSAAYSPVVMTPS